MKSRLKGKGTERHIVGEIERFDQKHEMYKRPFWDDSVKEIGDWSNISPSMKRPGYTIQDLAYRDAGWYVAYGDNEEETFGRHKGLSRAGILITPKFGPRIRLVKVVTDLPLALDEPIDFGVWDFCLSCEKCAQFCPGKAINFGDPTTEIHNISNNKGLYRWPVNAEKCLNFWKSNTTECGNCIRVCPFNKPLGWLHDLMRWGIKYTPWMNSFFVRMDDLFGYGKQKKPDHFWDK